MLLLIYYRILADKLVPMNSPVSRTKMINHHIKPSSISLKRTYLQMISVGFLGLLTLVIYLYCPFFTDWVCATGLCSFRHILGHSFRISICHCDTRGIECLNIFTYACVLLLCAYTSHGQPFLKDILAPPCPSRHHRVDVLNKIVCTI